ncbi:MAG: hypothetical protein COB53_07455 [Elusimicrobia bacterium]|nr:MAG: hypothetical protein COB53_07455 [Elusimicrobiota bacterium]
MFRAFIALLITAPAAAMGPPDTRSMIKPTSSIHVVIREAHVVDLECSRRKSGFETTRHSARHFPYLIHETFGGELDPRQMVTGIFSTMILVPITAVLVPWDLISMPFRRECDFKLTITGQLQEWAGRTSPNKPVGIEGSNLLEPGVEGVAAPQVYNASGNAMSDNQAFFSISIDGHVGKSKEFNIRFLVDGREANSLSLRRTGRLFLLEEQDPGFGTGVHENASREIKPINKKY